MDVRDFGMYDGYLVKFFVGGDFVIGWVGVVVVLYGLQQLDKDVSVYCKEIYFFIFVLFYDLFDLGLESYQ